MNKEKQMDLKSGVIWNTINTLGRLGISFLSTMILARILTPSDFGLYGVLMIFITVSELLSDSGMGGYLVKKQDPKEIDYSTLFVYNMSVSIILYTILFCIAPLIARLYNEDSLVLATRLLGLTILFQAFSITANSRLLKNFEFKSLAIISLLSGIAGLVAAVIWAYVFGGYFALIIQLIVSVGLNSLGMIYVAKYLPKLAFSWITFKEQFSFGVNLMGSTIVQSITNNISNNVIAKVFNVRISGLYSQSSKLQSIPVSLVQSVLDKTFFPLFSKMNDNVDEMLIKARKLWRFVYAFGFLGIALIICFAEPLVEVVLGNQWTESVFYFKLLMLASFPSLIKYVNRNILKAMGSTFSIFIMELIPTIIIGLFLLVTIVDTNIYYVLVGFIVGQFFSCLASIFYLRNVSKNIIGNIVKDILIFIPLGLIPSLFSLFLDFKLMTSLLYIALTIILVSVYILIGNKEYREAFDYINKKISRK